MVYLDNSATTRQLDEVTKAMMENAQCDYGNPSSLHRMGLKAEKSVKQAREQVTREIGDGFQLYFTGSGTEADNIAILGGVSANRKKGNKVITSKAEHPAVLESFKALEEMGLQVTYLDVDAFGKIDLDQLQSELNQETIFVSLMLVNNELGTIQPIEEVCRLIRQYDKIVFHTDAVQAFGKMKMRSLSSVDMVTVSGHKIHGPKGIGALALKKDVKLKSPVYGGGQESGIRSGTENVPGIVGFGLAAEKAYEEFSEHIQEQSRVRKYLMDGILIEIGDVRINSPEEKDCISSILNVSFLGTRGEVLLHMLEEKEIFVSTGSACSSKKRGESHVLKAAGLSPSEIEGAIRFSFSRFNTIDEMDYVLSELKKAVRDIRKIMKR